jgi:hypothetical protein
MGKMEKYVQNLVGKANRKRPLWRPGLGWENTEVALKAD